VDVTLAELHLEAFLPADQRSADYLRRAQDAIRYGCSGSPRRENKLAERWVAQGSPWTRNSATVYLKKHAAAPDHDVLPGLRVDFKMRDSSRDD
jgi:hypothetical protein